MLLSQVLPCFPNGREIWDPHCGDYGEYCTFHFRSNLSSTNGIPSATYTPVQRQQRKLSNSVLGEHLDGWPRSNTSCGWFLRGLSGPKMSRLITSLSTLPIFPNWAPKFPSFGSVVPKSIYTRTLTHPAHFSCEDGNSIYLRNVGSTAHSHTVQRPKSRINIIFQFIYLFPSFSSDFI
jgi:hypothetical protein